jgi:hypothetical protein
VTPAVFVVAECFEVSGVVVVDAPGELRVVDGGERHRLRGVEDPPGDRDASRVGPAQPACTSAQRPGRGPHPSHVCNAILMVVHATLGTVMDTYRWASEAREW